MTRTWSRLLLLFAATGLMASACAGGDEGTPTGTGGTTASGTAGTSSQAGTTGSAGTIGSGGATGRGGATSAAGTTGAAGTAEAAPFDSGSGDNGLTSWIPTESWKFFTQF